MLQICLILLAIQALPALSDPIIFNRFGVRFGVRSRTLAGGVMSSTGGRKTGRRQRVRTLAFFRIVGHLFSICRCHENITATPKSGGFPNFAFCATFIVEMTVTIPSERLANITLNERDALVDIAIGLYKREQVSLGRAAEISG